MIWSALIALVLWLRGGDTEEGPIRVPPPSTPRPAPAPPPPRADLADGITHTIHMASRPLTPDEVEDLGHRGRVAYIGDVLLAEPLLRDLVVGIGEHAHLHRDPLCDACSTWLRYREGLNGPPPDR